MGSAHRNLKVIRQGAEQQSGNRPMERSAVKHLMQWEGGKHLFYPCSLSDGQEKFNEHMPTHQRAILGPSGGVQLLAQ